MHVMIAGAGVGGLILANCARDALEFIRWNFLRHCRLGAAPRLRQVRVAQRLLIVEGVASFVAPTPATHCRVGRTSAEGLQRPAGPQGGAGIVVLRALKAMGVAKAYLSAGDF